MNSVRDVEKKGGFHTIYEIQDYGIQDVPDL